MALALIVSVAILASSVIALVGLAVVVVDLASLAGEASYTAAFIVTVKVAARTAVSTRVSQLRTFIDINFTVSSTPT